MSKIETINQATAVAVVGAVSPTLHPDALLPMGEALAGDDGAHASAYQAGRQGLHELYQAMAELEQANTLTRQRFGTGQVVNGSSIQAELPDDVAAQLSADMGNRFTRAAQVFDRNLETVNGTIDTLSKRIDGVLASKQRDAVTAQNLSDLRHYVKDLPDSKRMDFCHRQIEAGDIETAHAIFSTSPYASGFTKTDVAILRDLASKTFAPAEHAKLAAAIKLRDHMHASAKVFAERFKQITPRIRENPQSAAVKKLRGAA